MPSSGTSSSSKSSVKILPGATVCNECELRGDITIGPMSVVHPRASIIAEAGPIVIGDNTLIEEQAVIVNRLPDGANTHSTPVLIIGANNVFEVDSYCEAVRIGDNNVIEMKSHVGRGVELTNGCIVGSGCHLTEPEVIPENTVIFGSKCNRRQQVDRPQPQTLQLDFLHKVLPNYHHLKKQQKKVPAS